MINKYVYLFTIFICIFLYNKIIDYIYAYIYTHNIQYTKRNEKKIKMYHKK